MLTKVCKKCELEQPVEKFLLRKQRNGTFYRIGTCAGCAVKANLAHRQANRETYNSNAQARRSARKQRAVEYKGGKCTDCSGVFHFSAFDFHHRDPTTKHKDPGLLMGSTDEVLFKELDKCDLLCANCHRIKHYHEGY